MTKYSLFYFNNSLTISGNGLFMSKENVSEDQFTEIKKLNESGELTATFLNRIFNANLEEIVENEEKVSVYETLFNKTDRVKMELKGGSVFMTGIPIAMTETICETFLEAIASENWEYLDALKKFWVLACRNPNARTRKEIDGFMKRGNFQLASNGWIVGYRSALTKQKPNPELANVVRTSAETVKSWKKGLSTYAIYLKDEQYELHRASNEDQDGFIGNLEELFNNLDRIENGWITDGKTKTFDIRVGTFQVETKVEDDPTVTCGPGLHFVNQPALGVKYYTTSFGDQYMIVLVNPKDVRALPIDYEFNKARTSRYYVLDFLGRDEEDMPVFPEKYLGDVIQLDTDLEQKLKDSDFQDLVDLFESELEAGQIEIGELEKLVKTFEISDENVFQTILQKIEEFDTENVPKRNMDVYERPEPNCCANYYDFDDDDLLEDEDDLLEDEDDNNRYNDNYTNW